MSAVTENNRTLLIALAANLGIAVSKFVAAAITGSSAMLTEGVHSIVDSANQLLLLWGRRQSKKPPDRKHPFGYGRELYFWSFVVALLVFALGAAMAGIVAAAAGLALSQTTGNPVFDGAASIVIGLILGVTATLLAKESKALLIGEAADPELVECIRGVAAAHAGIAGVGVVLT